MGIRDVDNYTDCATGGPTFNACDLHFKKMMSHLLFLYLAGYKQKTSPNLKNQRFERLNYESF